MNPIVKKSFYLLSIVYCLLLLYILFLRNIGVDYPWTYTEYLYAMSNFIPLKNIYTLLTTPAISTPIIVRFLVNFFGNILLFIPLGIILPFFFKKLRTFKQFLRTTIIIIFLIEIIQLFTMLGIFDMDDILLDIVGAIIGYFCFKKQNIMSSEKKRSGG